MGYSTEDDKIIGQTIRKIRYARGLTTEDLGSRIGVTYQQISKYERGIDRVAGSRIIQIANVLDVPIIALFPDGSPVDDDGKALIYFMQSFNELSEDTQHELKKLVKQLASVGA